MCLDLSWRMGAIVVAVTQNSAEDGSKNGKKSGDHRKSELELLIIYLVAVPLHLTPYMDDTPCYNLHRIVLHSI